MTRTSASGNSDCTSLTTVPTQDSSSQAGTSTRRRPAAAGAMSAQRSSQCRADDRTLPGPAWRTPPTPSLSWTDTAGAPTTGPPLRSRPPGSVEGWPRADAEVRHRGRPRQRQHQPYDDRCDGWRQLSGPGRGLCQRLLGPGADRTGVHGQRRRARPGRGRRGQTAPGHIVVSNVEELDLVDHFGRAAFDVVIFGDVLEHLRRPLDVLRMARPLLAPGGFVVASIPNIAHGAVRLALLEGRFDYRPLGLLDDTHVRFFTRESVEALFRDAGLIPVQMRRTTAGLFETEFGGTPADHPPELIARILADPEATTYQFVVKAVIDNAANAVRALHDREEAARREIESLRRELQQARAAARACCSSR